MSPRTLARRFRDATGTTPTRWLTHQRIVRAQELLTATDLPIEAIAHRVGLGTAANLRQHFRAATGMAPAAYRRRYQHHPRSRDGVNPLHAAQGGTRTAGGRLATPNGRPRQSAGA